MDKQVAILLQNADRFLFKNTSDGISLLLTSCTDAPIACAQAFLKDEFDIRLVGFTYSVLDSVHDIIPVIVHSKHSLSYSDEYVLLREDQLPNDSLAKQVTSQITHPFQDGLEDYLIPEVIKLYEQFILGKNIKDEAGGYMLYGQFLSEPIIVALNGLERIALHDVIDTYKPLSKQEAQSILDELRRYDTKRKK